MCKTFIKRENIGHYHSNGIIKQKNMRRVFLVNYVYNKLKYSKLKINFSLKFPLVKVG